MKTVVISYSMTGNNEALATSLAAALKAEHVRLTERKARSMRTIVMDMIFKRTPKIISPTIDAKSHDLVVFVAPIWMGQIATPMRACFQRVAPDVTNYAFVSISGGADGPNPNLGSELEQRLGKPPVSLVDLHIADLLPPEPKPTRKDTSNYQVTDRDVAQLTDTVVTRLVTVMDGANPPSTQA